MKNLNKFFGIIAFVAIMGFSMAACDDGGSNGDGDGDLNPDWNKTYSGSTSSVVIRNSGTEIDFTGHTDGGLKTQYGDNNTNLAAITISGGGDVKQGGSTVGKYAYVYKGSDKIGILASGVYNGNPIYMLGLGKKTSNDGGAASVVNNFTSNGATFAPAPVITDIVASLDVTWSGTNPNISN